MQLKTVSSIGLVFLLVFGVVGVASAQDVAGTQGVVIRVDKPAANTWVAVDGKIELRVLTYDDRLNAGFNVTLMDSATADNAAADAAGVHFRFEVPNHAINGDEDISTDATARNITITNPTGAAVTVVKGHKAGIDTFRITMTLSTGEVTSKNASSVKVVIDPLATPDAANGPISNLATNAKITPASSGFGATIVGDGVKFGIDNDPPETANVFSKIELDIEKLNTDTLSDAGVDTVRIKVGDVVKLEIGLNTSNLLNSGANKIQVGLVEQDSAFKSAPIMFTLSGDKLYNPEAKVQTEVEEGSFGDLQDIRLVGFASDVAGNLSADSANVIGNTALQGAGFDSDGWGIIIDGTSPKITMTYPHPDSANDTRITAETAQDIQNSYAFEAGNVAPALNPLKISVSEEVDSIHVAHGDSTRSFGRYVDANDEDGDGDRTDTLPPTGADSSATLVLKFGYEAAGGTVGDLKVMVWDTHGNKSELVNDAIVHDGIKPTVSKLFPTKDSAPTNADNDNEPTINLATKDPVFQIDEELDSLAVRYSEVGGSKVVRQGFGSGNVRLETTGNLVTWPVADTTFAERQRFELEVLAIDLAGNASVTKSGQLTFTRGFGNPDADQFKIVADPAEKQVAGTDITLTMSVLDTTLSRIEERDVRAVTYHTVSAVAVIVSGSQADALEGVTFSGTGVSAAPSFNLPADLAAEGKVAKAAVLDGDGWHAGQRTVNVKSTKTLSGAMIMAAEGSVDATTGAYTVRISGQAAKNITVEVAEFSKFMVTAKEGQLAGSNMAGAFTVNVLPVDAFDNASTKIDNTVGSETYANVAVTFASSNAAVAVPAGNQVVPAGGADFGAVASDNVGSATITVRTATSDYTTGDDANQTLSGSVTVNIVSEDGDGPDPGAPAAVANVVAQDYMGADGQGDQGGVVVISFPNSAQHEAVTAYQISREIDSTTGVDDEGNVVELEEPVKKWVVWTSVSFASDAGDEMGDAGSDMQTVIVPAIDNVATNWGVKAVTESGESEVTTASKRVFTKESIQQTLQLLGMAPEAGLLTDEELNDQFNAPEDYVKSLIGDQKNVIFAPVNPDVSALVGSGNVPANIRTSHAGDLLSSARTVTEEPVAAVDNIAPAAISGGSGTGAGGVILNWTASADEGTVGSIPYRGYNIPIAGVNGYRVMRGTSADNLELVATLAAGSTRFNDDTLPEGVTTMIYRIDAFDDNNVTMSSLITITDISIRAAFADANGDPVYLMVLPAQGGNLEMDFEDVIAFGAAFGSQKGDANYNPQADVDDDGAVGFSDLATAAGSFGRVAVLPAGSKLAVVPQRPGVNADTEMTLQLASEKVLVGETVSLTVSMANAKALNGYGLELAYDADKFEFVSAVPADNDLLKSDGGETPLFKNWPEEGRISVVNLITESGTVSGEGALVTFTFKVLREFEDNARFEIAQGVVFDSDQLQNPVVTLGALDVQSTPTEFALHQNYPNPFNPQTNIPYDLAEGGDVVLRIYNLLGQEVRTLVREQQAPGRYTVQWSGMDDRGVSVSSGIYFYQVSVAGKFQDAKRLMLLK